MPPEPEEDTLIYSDPIPSYHDRLLPADKPGEPAERKSAHVPGWSAQGSVPRAVESMSRSMSNSQKARLSSQRNRYVGAIPSRRSLSREPQDVPDKRSLSAITVQSGRGAKRGKSNMGGPVDDPWRSRLGAPTIAEAPYDMRRALHTQASELEPPPRDRSDLSILQRAGRALMHATGFRPQTPPRGGTPVPKRRRGMQPLPVLTREDVARRTRSPRGHLDPKKHAEFVKERHPGLKLHKLSKQESEEERARFVKKAERRYLRHIAQDLATGDLTPAEEARIRAPLVSRPKAHGNSRIQSAT